MARPLTIDRDFLLDAASALVNIESPAPREQPAVDAVERIAAGLGMASRRIPLEPGRDNLLASLGEGSPAVCLCAHADTVPASGRSVPRATVESGRLHGLGSCDDKGPIAAMLAAVRALRESGWKGPGRIDLLITVEEETEGRGIHSVLDSGYRCDYAIVAEPTGMNVAVAHPGILFLQVQGAGTACHGSTPERGVNAVDLVYSFVLALRERVGAWPAHPLVGSSSVNLGALHGGDRPNRVPDEAEALVDVRVAPPRTTAEAQQAAKDIAAGDLAGVSARIAKVGEPLNTDPSCRLVQALQRAGESSAGRAPETTGWRAWSEAGVFQSRLGVEAAVFGPGELAQAHSSDEFVEIEQLHASASVYAGAAQTLAAST
jgi:succinyl-diaminopimelate desuccinylase